MLRDHAIEPGHVHVTHLLLEYDSRVALSHCRCKLCLCLGLALGLGTNQPLANLGFKPACRGSVVNIRVHYIYGIPVDSRVLRKYRA
jgi:hypothetical protein